MNRPRKKVSPKEVAPVPPLTAQEEAEVRRFHERRKERVPSPAYTVTPDGENHVISTARHPDQHYAAVRLSTTFGTTEQAFSERMIKQVINAVYLDRSRPLDERELNAALVAVAGMAPRDEAEGMLATQMVATHWLAMEMLRNAGITTSRLILQDAGNLAIKLLRTYTTQMEALQRYRGQASEQRVTVEHVHVHSGGQAIVGAVTAGAPGANGKIEEQCRANKITHSPEPALWSQDSALDAVPVARDAER